MWGKSGVTVEGTSGGGFVATGSNSSRVLIRIENCNGCTIRNLTIEGNGRDAAGLGIFNSSNTTVEANQVTNISYPAMAGIVARGNRNNRYAGNLVTRMLGDEANGVRGMWIGNGSAGSPEIEWYPTIANNTVRDAAASGFVGHAVGATFSGNTVDGTLGSGIKCVPPRGQGGQTTIQGNTIRNTRFQGVQIDRADSAVVIDGNTIVDSTAGIYAAGGSFVNARISGNTIEGNRIAGVYLYDGQGVSVTGNRISGGGHGILLEALASSSIQGVRISGNTITGVGGDGIGLWGREGRMNDLRIESNSIEGNSHGLLIEERNVGSISGVSVSGNCFAGNRAGNVADLRVVNVLGSILGSGSCGEQPVVSTSAITAPTPAPAPAPTPTPAPAPTPTPAPTPAPTPTPAPAPAPAPPPASMPASAPMTPIRVNAGGGEYRDASGALWSADYGFTGGTSMDDSEVIGNTGDTDLYRSSRSGFRFSYSFAVPAGKRTVTLKFADCGVTSVGSRLMDVAINGEEVLGVFDIVAAAGGAKLAVDRTFQATSDGRITIELTSRISVATISAIEIQ